MCDTDVIVIIDYCSDDRHGRNQKEKKENELPKCHTKNEKGEKIKC